MENRLILELVELGLRRFLAGYSNLCSALEWYFTIQISTTLEVAFTAVYSARRTVRHILTPDRFAIPTMRLTFFHVLMIIALAISALAIPISACELECHI